MEKTIRPETMQRITTLPLANAFIAEQVEAIRNQVGIRRCFWHFPAVWIPLWSPHC